MCISKLAVNWWKLVGIRRLNCGYFSGLETYWMMPFMLRHELALESSVIIQYLFYMLSLFGVTTACSRASYVHLWRFINTHQCTLGSSFVRGSSFIRSRRLKMKSPSI